MNTSDIGSPPSKMRLLNERWQEIQHEIDREKQFRSQSLEEQMAHIEDKLQHSKAISEQKVQIIGDKIGKLKHDVQGVQDQREQLAIGGGKRLAKVEEGLERDIDN